MEEYKDETYIDEDDRKPRLIKLLLIIVLITIILVIIISCGMKKKETNAYLKSLTIENEKLSPQFDRNIYNYIVNTNKVSVKVLCEASSKKAGTIGCNKTVYIYENTEYSIVVNAENGNKKTYIIRFIKEDNKEELEKEQIEPEEEKINDNKTNGDKKSDQVNNTTSKKQEVKNYLSINSITGNSSKWTTSITLKINASSSNGLHYSFDGGKSYSKTNTKTFYENQTVNVVVKDNVGNKKTQNIYITRIDNTKPNVTISEKNRTNETVILSAEVTPKNTNSGYSYEWYKDGVKVSSDINYKASKTGNYTVKVTTGSGNSATSKSYLFTVIKVGCPKIETITENKEKVNEKTWIESPIYFKVTPSEETVSFDVYYNEPGNFNNLIENYNYFNTLQGKLRLRIVNSGIRKAKFVVRDKDGNSSICYSGVYYIK